MDRVTSDDPEDIQRWKFFLTRREGEEKVTVYVIKSIIFVHAYAPFCFNSTAFFYMIEIFENCLSRIIFSENPDPPLSVFFSAFFFRRSLILVFALCSPLFLCFTLGSFLFILIHVLSLLVFRIRNSFVICSVFIAPHI